MKRLLSLTSLMVLVSILAACSSSSNTPTSPGSHGESIRILEGSVEGYQGSKTVLKAYKFDEPSPDKVVGIGQIEEDGTFNFEFSKDINVRGNRNFLCAEDPLDSSDGRSVMTVSASKLYLQATGNDSFSNTVGFLVLANSDWPKEFEARSGDKQIYWDYVEQDTEFQKTCENGSAYNLSLKAGWNTSIVAFDSSETGTTTSSAITDNFSWYLLPHSAQ